MTNLFFVKLNLYLKSLLLSNLNFMDTLSELKKEMTKRTEYYRNWERANRDRRNEYHRNLYRLKRDQIRMEV